jgi:hypothetical protein
MPPLSRIPFRRRRSELFQESSRRSDASTSTTTNDRSEAELGGAEPSFNMRGLTNEEAPRRQSTRADHETSVIPESKGVVLPPQSNSRFPKRPTTRVRLSSPGSDGAVWNGTTGQVVAESSEGRDTSGRHFQSKASTSRQGVTTKEEGIE